MTTGKLIWTEGSDLPPFPLMPEMAAPEERMDARVTLAGENGEALAHAALWWKETPSLEGEPVGAIGGFGAKDGESAGRILEAACGRLAQEGLRLAVGPMNGNTWRRYRFATWSGGRGPFLLEPRNPEPYPQWWQASGFAKLAGYSSSSVPLDGVATVSPALEKRLAAAGVRIREMDPDRFEEELAAIHEITLAGFSKNFLYTPLPKEDFIGAYTAVRERVDPRFVLIAERGGGPCGYVFAIPDLEAAARGESPALIVKTLTVDPSSRCVGLGSLLVDQVQRRGHAGGFREALHALQFDGNNVLRITSRHGGEAIRRYTVFSKNLR